MPPRRPLSPLEDSLMGGASGDGVVYALNEKTGSETTIFSFNGTNGAGPNALTVTQDGIIYATS